LTVIDVNALKTIVAVPEAAIPDMQAGSGAEILFDALPGRQYRGRVVRISPLVDTATRSVSVEIQIANPGRILRPGMFARVRVGGAAAAPALSIPRSALLTRGNTQGVYLLGEGNTAIFREIEMGRNEDGWVEVLRGLDPGEVFVSAGAQSLNDGDRVRVAGEEGGEDEGTGLAGPGGGSRDTGLGERGSRGERP
jgi:membrane fusion protein (multidrug efflux system)